MKKPYKEYMEQCDKLLNVVRFCKQTTALAQPYYPASPEMHALIGKPPVVMEYEKWNNAWFCKECSNPHWGYTLYERRKGGEIE